MKSIPVKDVEKAILVRHAVNRNNFYGLTSINPRPSILSTYLTIHYFLNDKNATITNIGKISLKKVMRLTKTDFINQHAQIHINPKKHAEMWQ